MEYKQSDKNFMIRLFRGEEIMASLKKLAEKENILAGSVVGIGAVKGVEIGVFDLESKDYRRHTFEDQLELLNLTGNFTTVDQRPFLHVHVTLSDSNYQALGGHLISAMISVTGEFFVTSYPFPVTRSLDTDTQLQLMDFSQRASLR